MIKAILVLLLVLPTLASAQLINGGVEIWDTTFTAAYESDLVSLYGIPNPKAGVLNRWVLSSPYGAAQTTDSYSGNYSLILHNWYNYASEWVTYHQPLNYRPKYLQGYFKYITGGANGLSHGDAYVALTRSNGTSRDTIATGAFQFDSTHSFTPFQMTLNYVSASIPDSIDIYIINSRDHLRRDGVGHLLYLDNLALSESPLDVHDSNIAEDFVSAFPNPASTELTIQKNSSQVFQFSLYNTLGEKIIEETLRDRKNTVKLSDCSEGIYFYRMTCGNYVMKTGTIIKR